MGTSPAIAPLIGGVLLKYFSWRSSFIFLAVFIVVTLFLCLFFFEESLPQERRTPFRVKTMVQNLYSVLKNKKFLFYSSVPCVAYAAYFGYISESPFFLTQLGLEEKNLGYSYTGVSLSYVLGNLAAKRLTKVISLEKAVRLGYFIFYGCWMFVFCATLF